MKKYYDAKYVEELFDDMSGSYARMNYITSFGFSERWRAQFIEILDITDGDRVVDMMTGMGECWTYILDKKAGISLTALDISEGMMRYARPKITQFDQHRIQLMKENVLENSLAKASADYVVSGFGLKTFDAEQLDQLAGEIERILRPGGQFSLIDVSVPPNPLLRFPYMFYLKKVIPILGRLFLGNPEIYKMLGVYTEAFGNAREVEAIFKRRSFKVTYQQYFYGCASGIRGVKL